MFSGFLKNRSSKMTLFVLGTLALLAFLAFATWRSALILRELAPTTNLLLLPAENLMRVVLILVCLLLARVSGLPDDRFGWSTTNTVHFLFIGLAVGVVVALIVPLLTRWAVTQFGGHIYSPIVVQSILPRRRIEWVWVPLALAPAVALEELLFRSLLLGGLSIFAPPILLAVVWSIIFGTMHAPQGSFGIVVAAALGLLLSILFLVTQNLLAPMFAHYAINLLQLIWASKDRYWEKYFESSHP